MNKIFKGLVVLATALIVNVISYAAIKISRDYGWFIFVFTPVLLGFLPSFLICRRESITKRTNYFLGQITLLVAFLVSLLFGTEGLICLFMFLPISIPFVFLGSYLGYHSNGGSHSKNNNLIILFLMGVGSMSFDVISDVSDLIPVTTSVEVNASISSVWNNVVTFDKIPEPVDWIFKTGISYPTDATIKGRGEGAIRDCNFTTGSFVEPITNWDEPNLLQFDVLEQPIPMNEMNPFWDIHPQHLDGYFLSRKGQFKLTALGENRTLLEGTTWYTLDIAPVVYWKQWSDFIIHRIHERVLKHIKVESEKK